MNEPGWGGLRSIIEEARQIEREDRMRPEVDCPICGEVLQVNSRGVGNCPMGHYTTNNAARPAR